MQMKKKRKLIYKFTAHKNNASIYCNTIFWNNQGIVYINN